MTELSLPQWLLDEESIQTSRGKGFEYSIQGDKFLLKRKADDARVWPHIDGYISCFVRHGQYVKHKKFIDLPRALDRRFGD